MNEFKILHTGDWHLGKRLFKESRLEEQEFFLNNIIKKIISEKINLLLIAGDIFDVPSPPNEAQRLFYNFIYQLGKIENFQTILITGNHDSQALFEIPIEFFKEHNCFIYPKLSSELSSLNHYIKWNGKTVGIKSLPYFRNFELINHIDESDDESIKNFFCNFFNTWDESCDFKILLSHHCFGKYSAAGSEHAIHLSGVDYFPLEWLEEKFDYVALGHIHKKQTLSKNPLSIYPGSPYPLRFSESNLKYFSQITLESNGNWNQDFTQIEPHKLLLRIKTNLINLESKLEKLISETTQRSFLEVTIETERPVQGVADMIRDKLKKTQIKLLSFRAILLNEENTGQSLKKIDELNLPTLFTDYYKEKFNTQVIPKEIMDSFKELLENVSEQGDEK